MMVVMNLSCHKEHKKARQGIMAWEVKENRGECNLLEWETAGTHVRGNTLAPKNKILIEGELEPGTESTRTKRYWHDADTLIEHEGQHYIRVIPLSLRARKTKRFTSRRYSNEHMDAMSRAIEYVQWFQ